jgi:transposase-like protein
MDFPILDLMDQPACYRTLLDLLHPEGLTCPRCAAGPDRYAVHRRRRRSPVVDYRCKGCRRVFNLFTGTAWQGTPRTPADILLILRGFIKGTATAELARELKASRRHLLELRHEVQARAAAACDRTPLSDDVVEADELYQNAGEKRSSAHRPRRPTAAAGEPGGGPRHLGHRPAARGGTGGPPQPAADDAGGPTEHRGRTGEEDGGAADAARGDGGHRRLGRGQAAVPGGAETRIGQPRPGGVGPGRRRRRGARGAYQHLGGVVDGAA